MSNFFKSYPNIKKVIIISLVLIFLIAIGDLIHYIKRIHQINEYLDKYGNISYSVQKIDYPNHYGPLTEILIYNNQSDTFYLHDNENDFDFIILLRDQGDLFRVDNYLQRYLGNRFSKMCEKEISIPQECKIQNFKIYVHAPFNSNLTLNSFKNMTDEELKKVIKDTQQSISEGFFSGSLYFDVKLEIDGDQIQSEHLLNEIVMYFKNITLAIEGNYLINGKSYKISDDK